MMTRCERLSPKIYETWLRCLLRIAVRQYESSEKKPKLPLEAPVNLCHGTLPRYSHWALFLGRPSRNRKSRDPASPYGGGEGGIPKNLFNFPISISTVSISLIPNASIVFDG
jgi:hypothetical protein